MTALHCWTRALCISPLVHSCSGLCFGGFLGEGSAIDLKQLKEAATRRVRSELRWRPAHLPRSCRNARHPQWCAWGRYGQVLPKSALAAWHTRVLVKAPQPRNKSTKQTAMQPSTLRIRFASKLSAPKQNAQLTADCRRALEKNNMRNAV